MKLYTAKCDCSASKRVVADDMILTKGIPTAAGSRMLEGYMSLIGSEALDRALSAGYELAGKAAVGEFAIDLVGETAYGGACVADGKLLNASAEIVKSGDADAALTLDVNGSVRRAAAQSGLVSIKPTYGTVSRYGTIPVACSGETVSVMAKSSDECAELLAAILGHDPKDGTSLSDEPCARVASHTRDIKRVALPVSMTKELAADSKAVLDGAVKTLTENGVEVVEIDDEIIVLSRAAWNILMCAELCNNVSRYDGVKYGYRAKSFSGIDELYTNSRTEAFGELLKTAILFGSDTLSTENYMKVYDKALRTRRVIVNEFARLFESFDAVLLPVCSAMSYAEDTSSVGKQRAFSENIYTSPASISGLPAVVSGGVQLVGPAFCETALLEAAKLLEKEGK